MAGETALLLVHLLLPVLELHRDNLPDLVIREVLVQLVLADGLSDPSRVSAS